MVITKPKKGQFYRYLGPVYPVPTTIFFADVTDDTYVILHHDGRRETVRKEEFEVLHLDPVEAHEKFRFVIPCANYGFFHMPGFNAYRVFEEPNLSRWYILHQRIAQTGELVLEEFEFKHRFLSVMSYYEWLEKTIRALTNVSKDAPVHTDTVTQFLKINELG